MHRPSIKELQPTPEKNEPITQAVELISEGNGTTAAKLPKNTRLALMDMIAKPGVFGRMKKTMHQRVRATDSPICHMLRKSRCTAALKSTHCATLDVQ